MGGESMEEITGIRLVPVEVKVEPCNSCRRRKNCRFYIEMADVFIFAEKMRGVKIKDVKVECKRYEKER